MPIYTNSQLADLHLKGEELMANGQVANQYKADAEAAKAVLQNQTIRVRALTDDPEKDKVVEVSYIDTCAIEDEACPADFCDLSGTDIATKKKQFELTLCRMASFAVDEDDTAKSIYGVDDAVPKGQIAAMNKLDEYISRQTLLALNANAGTNRYPGKYTYDAGSKSTLIPEADYNRKIVPYFEKVASMHKIPGTYYIDNGDLWIDWRNAQLDRPNGEGAGDGNRVDAIRMYFDMFGFAQAAITPDSTFMVGQHAVGIAHRVYNTQLAGNARNIDLKGGNQTRYKVESINLPGIWYDAFYHLDCSGRRFKHTWNFVYTGGIFTAVEGCEVGDTGIMSFSRLEATT